MKLLEEFWRGNIEPADYSTSSEYKKLRSELLKAEEELLAVLGDEHRALFERYCELSGRLHSESESLLFQSSFKLGAQMMMEIKEK